MAYADDFVILSGGYAAEARAWTTDCRHLTKRFVRHDVDCGVAECMKSRTKAKLECLIQIEERTAYAR